MAVNRNRIWYWSVWREMAMENAFSMKRNMRKKSSSRNEFKLHTNWLNMIKLFVTFSLSCQAIQMIDKWKPMNWHLICFYMFFTFFFPLLRSCDLLDFVLGCRCRSYVCGARKVNRNGWRKKKNKTKLYGATQSSNRCVATRHTNSNRMRRIPIQYTNRY